MVLFRRHRDVDEVFVSKCFAYFRIIGIKILVERVGDYREFDPGAFIGQISTLEAHQPIGVSVFVLFRNVVLYCGHQRLETHNATADYIVKPLVAFADIALLCRYVF